jgi:type VI secretion system protein ImpF
MIASLLSRLSDNRPLCEEEDDFLWEASEGEFLLAELKLLFMSRVRSPEIEDIPLLNASVLNYGINESLSQVNEVNSRCLVLEQRIVNAIMRFEPRLTGVSLKSNLNASAFILFTLHAYYMNSPVVIELKWNDCTGRFYFHE